MVLYVYTKNKCLIGLEMRGLFGVALNEKIELTV